MILISAVLTVSFFSESMMKNVITVQAASIQINKKSAKLYVGNTVKLKILNVANSNKVKWSSSNSKVASVSKGIVTGRKKGTATIKAKYKGKTYKSSITVKSASISEKQLTLRVGYGYSLSVLNTNRKVSWMSSDSSIARINSNGYISPVNIGNVTISAKVISETYKCTLKVVAAFGEDDFVFDEPDDEGYTNYIDYSTGKGDSWYWYFDEASNSYNSNRGINVGDTLEDFIGAYGFEEYTSVSSSDKYSKHFKNSNYPRTKYKLEYKLDQNYYYKSFYFDKDNNLVLIIWHR